MSKIYHIAKADFLQRARGYGFLIILGACIFAVYMYVPPPEADYATITIGKYRGIYNSAWIGNMVAMMSIIYLSLLGFYLVNNAVQRDRDTGVGQIIAASPISRTAFLSAKLLSNFFVLFLMVLVMVLMTIVMFFLRAETRELELWQLVSSEACVDSDGAVVVVLVDDGSGGLEEAADSSIGLAGGYLERQLAAFVLFENGLGK